MGTSAKYIKGQSMQGQLMEQHIRQQVLQMLPTGRYRHDNDTKLSLTQTSGKMKKPYNLCVNYLSLQRPRDWLVLKAMWARRGFGVGLTYSL